MAIVVELLSRDDKTLKHFYFDKNNVSIGRGYDNDLTIHDPYVCAKHLSVTAEIDDGERRIGVTNLSEVNGMQSNGASQNQADVTFSDIITIGRTRMRIFDATKPVPAALQLSALEENLQWLNSWRLTFSLTIVTALFLMLSQYLQTFGTFSFSGSINQVGGQIMLYSAWPLILGLLAKLNKKEVRLFSLFSLTWIFVLSIQLLSKGQQILLFNFSNTFNAKVLATILFITMLFAFMWFCLFVAFHQSNRRRNILATFATAVIIVPIFTMQLVRGDDFSPMPKYNAVILPVSFHFVAPSSTNDFIQNSDALFSEASESSEKAK